MAIHPCSWGLPVHFAAVAHIRASPIHAEAPPEDSALFCEETCAEDEQQEEEAEEEEEASDAEENPDLGFEDCSSSEPASATAISAPRQRGLLMRIQPWGNPRCAILLQQMLVSCPELKWLPSSCVSENGTAVGMHVSKTPSPASVVLGVLLPQPPLPGS